MQHKRSLLAQVANRAKVMLEIFLSSPGYMSGKLRIETTSTKLHARLVMKRHGVNRPK